MCSTAAAAAAEKRNLTPVVAGKKKNSINIPNNCGET